MFFIRKPPAQNAIKEMLDIQYLTVRKLDTLMQRIGKMATALDDVQAILAKIEGDTTALVSVQTEIVTEIGALVAKLAAAVAAIGNGVDATALADVVSRLTATHASLEAVTTALTDASKIAA
jgi:uncharacterized membrane protein